MRKLKFKYELINKMLKTKSEKNKKCCLIKVNCITFLPTQIGIPMSMAGTARPATSVIPTGAPTRVPSCHKIFFFLLHGFLPQNVQPDGLKETEIFFINIRDCVNFLKKSYYKRIIFKIHWPFCK